MAEAAARLPKYLLMSMVLLFLAQLAAVSATAQETLYDNGPSNGNVDAWDISFHVVSDSFNLADTSTIGGFTFTAWLMPGDTLTSAELSITSMESGGTTYFDQTVGFEQTNCVVNQLHADVCTESAIFDGPVLNAGTYWVNLQNAMAEGDQVYWDENSGPSMASATGAGTIPSESFTLTGCNGVCGGQSVPEPSSLILFGCGIASLMGMLRRRLL